MENLMAKKLVGCRELTSEKLKLHLRFGVAKPLCSEGLFGLNFGIPEFCDSWFHCEFQF
jgi:hypothetical protein